MTRRITSRTSRRARFAARSLAVLLAATAILAAVNLVAPGLTMRYDVTALGEQRLAPRTRALLDRLNAEFEIVLAGNWSAPEGQGEVPSRRARRQVFDLLTEMTRAQPRLRVTRIDTLSESGRADYADLLKRLVQRDQAVLDASLAAIRAAAAAVDEIAAHFDAVAPAIDQSAQAIAAGDSVADDVRRRLADLAATLRIRAGESRRRSLAAVEAATRPAGPVPVGQVDDAVTELRAILSALDTELGLLATGLAQQRDRTTIPAAVSDRLATIAQGADAARPRLRMHTDTLARLARPDVLRIARFLTTSPAALIIGPRDVGLTAIGFDALFPTTHDQQPGVEADIRAHVEDLLTTALTNLTNPDTPIVIFAHAEGSASLLEGRLIEDIRRRLELRRASVLEWPVLRQTDPPGTATLDPARRRPVVYVFLPTDATATVPPGPTGIPPQARLNALGHALRRIIDTGAPALVTVAPSPTAGLGIADEIADILAEFGLRADAARTLLAGAQGQQGWEVAADLRARLASGEHPFQKAVGGLPIQLLWPVAIEALPDRPEVVRVPVIEVADPAVWNEAEWEAMWRTVTPNQRSRVRGPGAPVPNPGIDGTRGPWHLGFLAERRAADARRQRLIAVGAYQWFYDFQTRPTQNVSGQIVLQNPGNPEFFEAAVAWLAGQDDLLAPGPTARAVARIRQLAPKHVAALQWGLIAGLPLCVLALGMLLRVLRG
ncbi:MAG: hypothetical protein KF866_09030 [Phycisphaeraceae bacterium]|nr:hypothetical protein [Phycisphaeraceae bacterium]